MNYVRRIIGAGVFFVLLFSAVGSLATISEQKNSLTRGVLQYEPQSHHFGDMYEGETNTTIFEIWMSGGCCELIYELTWNCPWVTVFPTSGVSNGEHDPITVTINTAGLDIGFHGCDIQITTNGGGNGVFNVTVFIVSHEKPKLAFSPGSYSFGVLPENVIESTTFDIWNSGNGTLIYDLSWTGGWVDVYPINGSSTGEHDPITVTVNTAGLEPDMTYQSSIFIDSNGGDEEFLVSFTIGTIPMIEIESISGGLFRIKTTITNTGTADAVDIDWKITLSGNGLVLSGKETTGTLASLPIGGEEVIRSGLILGFGDVDVTVTLQNAEALPIVGETPAKLFFFYIKI